MRRSEPRTHLLFYHLMLTLLQSDAMHRFFKVVIVTAVCLWGPVNAGLADIVAQFTDGNDNFNGGFISPTVNSYYGKAGDGWAGPWTTSKTASAAFSSGVINTNPINGSGNYLNATLTIAPNIAGQAAVGRQYYDPTDSGQLSQPHSISFDFRPETNFPVDANLSDRYQIWDNTSGNQNATSVNNTWAIAAYGDENPTGPGGVIGKNWGFLDGNLSSNAFTAQTFIDTGIAVQANTTYRFEIFTDPTTKTWSATITDGVNSFTSGTLLWRNQTAEQAGSHLFWGAQKSGLSEFAAMTYSLDNVSVSIDLPSSPSADFNGDGIINAADYVIWRKSGGTPQQYDDWLATFGQTVSGSGAGSGGTSVPEPTSLSFVLILIAGKLLHRGRRARHKMAHVYGKRWLFVPLFFLTLLTFSFIETASASDNPCPIGDYCEIPVEQLEDKVRGGMLGQLFGNMNGLVHEFKYIHEPGQVESYTPSLPDGAHTDDDTDIEWVYIVEMERQKTSILPPSQIVALWKKHINRRVWCANLYTRHLMDLGLEPPLTGDSRFNPWSHFNIAGQFSCETFGLIAPAMPQTASRIGLNYGRVAVSGEPTQATQLYMGMIATAFVDSDINRILDAGLASVDSRSEISNIVRVVQKLHQEHPDDWKTTRRLIKERWQKHDGAFRDQNGYELNTASTVAALLYGQADLQETLRHAFNFGWDCDNSAATAGTVVGVIKGRNWINKQGWEVKDRYRNTSRDQMPNDETISQFEDRVINCMKQVIREQGGEIIKVDGKSVCRIRREAPANVESLESARTLASPKKLFRQDIETNLGGDSPTDRARAAYLAICLGESARLQLERPSEWTQAVEDLSGFPEIARNVFNAISENGLDLQEKARLAGLEPPVTSQ